MEKDKVLGVITIPVTIQDVMENKKPELPDDIWQQMRTDLQDSCKIEIGSCTLTDIINAQLEKDCKGFRTGKEAECLIVDIDAEEIEKKKALVMKTIASVFDCNIIAARDLTNTLILYGKTGRAVNISKEDFLPVLFQNVEKWKVLRETLRDLTRMPHRSSKVTRVPVFPNAPFDVCFC